MITKAPDETAEGYSVPHLTSNSSTEPSDPF